MSYSFGMFFKEISQADVLPFVNRVCSEVASHPSELIEQAKYCIPSLRDEKSDNKTDRYWLSSLFEFQFVYWQDKKLIGMCGYTYPGNTEDMFTGHVTFQNSTDRDYAYDEWPQIDLFQKHVYESSSLEPDAIIKKYMNVTGDNKLEASEFYDDDPEYMRRSLVYDSVYKELALDDWLWGRENPSFIRLTVQALNNDETKFSAYRHLEKIKKGFQENQTNSDAVNDEYEKEVDDLFL